MGRGADELCPFISTRQAPRAGRGINQTARGEGGKKKASRGEVGERKGSARERKNQIKGRNSSEITELFIFPAASGDFFFFPPLRPPRPSGLLRLQAVCYSPASHHPSPATKHHVHFITPPCSAQRDLLISVSPVFMCDSARNVFTVPRALLDTARLRLNINIGSEGGGRGGAALL